MDRLCPRCRGTTADLLCPRCGVRTTDSTASVPTSTSFDPTFSAGGWLIGLLLAQGLYYALWHIASAWLLAEGGESAKNEFWDNSFAGLLTVQALQALALFAGAMLGAAGRKHGLLAGASLGLVNAVLLIGLPLVSRRPMEDLIWYVQPVLHVFVGAVGGAIGSRVWQPAPVLPPLAGDGRSARGLLTTILPDESTIVFDEPIPWLLIAGGIVVAVGGTLGARLIRDFVVVAGGGKGREMAQSLFITWEITLIAQLIGGAMAGAGSRGGLMFGFWVGLPAAIILVVIQATAAVHGPAVPAWLVGAAVTEGSPAALVIQGVQALVLGALGGWLGSLVLPADPGNRLAANR
jgi:hypothetical protein